jgi:hypothetical protein
MDRDAAKADRQDQALQGDTGMIGSESEEPGPGRDTSLTDPKRVEDAGPSDRSVFADEPPASGHSAFVTEDAGSADRTTVAEDQARQQRP